MKAIVVALGMVLTPLLSNPAVAQQTLTFPTYISGLSAASTANNSDLLYLLQAGSSKKITVGTLSGGIIFQPPGAGAIARTMDAKFTEWPTTTDYSSATLAYTYLNSVGGGTIFVPGNTTPTLPASYPNVTFDYFGPLVAWPFGGGTVFSNRTLFGFLGGPHVNNDYATFGVFSQSVGAGGNTPTQDEAMRIASYKVGWGSNPNTAGIGGVDGLDIYARQQGPFTGTETGDQTGIAINAAMYGVGGFSGGENAIEAATAAIDSVSSTIKWSIHTQIGQLTAIWTNSGQAIGYFTRLDNANATGGNIGFYAQNGGSAAWDFPFLYQNSSFSSLFYVSSAGSMALSGAAPTVAAGQIGYGGTTAVATNCGSLAGAAGCIVVNVAGTQHYVPYY
jgi:hypothetical protein